METMQKENSLVLNASSYGIEDSKAKQLEAVFIPMVEKFKELEDQYNEVLANKEITEEVCFDAKTVRNKYVKVRTGTDVVHKIAKEKLLIESRAVDGLRNIVKYASIDHENSLLEVEKHFERIEAERLEKVREERNSILEKFNVNPGVGDPALMPDDVWIHYIKSVEFDYKAQIEAEKKAEVERIADEKAEKERQRLAKIEHDKRNKIERERLAKVETERKEREKNEAKERTEYEAKLKKEREEKERIQKELQAKAEAEQLELIRIKDEEKAKAEEARKLALAPEKERLEKWVNDMKIMDIISDKMSKESALIASNIIDKFDSFKNWAKSEIDKI